MDEVWQVVLTWCRTLDAGLRDLVQSPQWWYRSGLSAVLGWVAGYYVTHGVTNFLAGWSSCLPVCRRCGEPFPGRGRWCPFRVGLWSSRWTCRGCGETLSLNLLPTMLVCAGVSGAYAWWLMASGCQANTDSGDAAFFHYRLLSHLVLLLLLIAATLTDLGDYIIPDEITFPGTLFGLGAATLVGNLQLVPLWVDWNVPDVQFFGPAIPQWIKAHDHLHGFAWSLAGLVVGAGVTWGLRSLSSLLLGQESLGFGDVTLMAMIGSFLGWQPVLCVFALAPFCALLIGLGSRWLFGRKAIPYGPYLACATVLVLCSWKWIWLATRELFGHPASLVRLAGIATGGLIVLLLLLRGYRLIPVSKR